jgi:hypothetical protein
VLHLVPDWLRRLVPKSLEGLFRLPREHFSVVLVRPTTGEARVVASPWSRYFADPFLLRRGGRDYLFFEDFDFLQRTGHISVCEIGADLTASEPVTALQEPHHLSYPLLFEQGGRLFMLPESSHSQTVDLYECLDFPARWTLRRRLLENVDAADTTLLEHDGRSFLFTSVREGASSHFRSLRIYSTLDLLDGPLEPHPVNARRLYADLPYTSGRGAGPFLPHGDTWLRPVQWSRSFYGEGMRLMRILRLTPSEFAEEPFTDPHPVADLIARYSPHHYSAVGDLAVLDTRDRWSYAQHLPLLGRRTRRAAR